ncbi:MAG TPA: NADH-quinone oxidoreductase subunit A [Candidatus Thermoplasmatota archaeon]|nr:NADH-quinone oxidoreductase subunit A [Candidatus Thermoplasmatota archaeon]
MEAAITRPPVAATEGGSNTASEALTYLPMVVLGGVAFLLVFLTLLGNRTLGPKRATPAKVSSYECGEKATPGARGPIDVQYYMFVLTFLVFDVEAMFLIPFALKFKDTSLIGTAAIVAIAIFVGLILVGYLYEIKKKLLAWRALE